MCLAGRGSGGPLPWAGVPLPPGDSPGHAKPSRGEPHATWSQSSQGQNYPGVNWGRPSISLFWDPPSCLGRCPSLLAAVLTLCR